MPTMDSVYIVTGMDAIINPDNIRPGMTSQDLQALETRMLEGGMLTTRVKEPQDKFQDELAATAKKYGINFGDAAPSKPATAQTAPTQAYSAPTYSQTAQTTPTYNYAQSLAASEYDEETGADSGDDEYDPSTSGIGALPSDILGSVNPNDAYGNALATAGDSYGGSYGATYGANSTMAAYTQEQQRVSRINNVIGEGVGFSLEQERKEDLKCAMLAEIDNLMDALEKEDIDLSRIPRVDRKSEYDDVSSVLKMLRHKNDHSRYCGFAEEFLLFGALAMERLFDGKTTYLSRYNPDLTGWHNHLNMKVKRMRTDTSQIVSSVMHDWNISPGVRILLELIPNMIIYSNMRSQQHGQVGLASDENMQAELANLNAL